MRFRSRLAKIIAVAAMWLSVVSGVSLKADMISYSTSIPASDAAGHGSLPTSASFTLPEFNPALGTLEGISIKFGLSYQGEVDILNVSGSPQFVSTATSSVPIVITAPSPGVPSLSASNSVSGVTISASLLNEYPGGISSTTIPFNPTSAYFASYEGIGSNGYGLAYNPGTYSGSTTAPGGTVFFGGDANASGTASVVYTYAAAPEPATVTLLCTGLLAIGSIRLRRWRLIAD